MYIPKIVLSGGPCAGKSKASRNLKIELEKIGFNVVAVTESAQELITNGVDRTSPYEFQKQIALHQLQAESTAYDVAQSLSNPVIICDRGLMDSKVYLEDNDFARLKKELNLTDIDMRDRYSAVFHLDSTASTDFYKKGEVRVESNEEATDLNARSLKAWCGNPHYRFIPVADTFDHKMSVLLDSVKHFLGYPKPLEIERKYLIKYPDVNHLLTLTCVKSEIEQSYLINNGKKFRVRKRGENGSYIYIKTEKHKISNAVYEEIEETISLDEYNNYLANSRVMGTISKDRYCLMYKGTYYEIDIFPFWNNQAYLEVELDNEEQPIKIPEFIEIIEDVTEKSEYKNSSLCKKIPREK